MPQWRLKHSGATGVLVRHPEIKLSSGAEAKDLLFGGEQQVLRFAQDDKMCGLASERTPYMCGLASERTPYMCGLASERTPYMCGLASGRHALPDFDLCLGAQLLG